MSTDDEVDRLIDERPGAELLEPVYDDVAYPVVPGLLYRSAGTTAAYMLLTQAGRIIVNTGMGFEAPHHKRLFDALRPAPTPYIVTTQGHVDHLGGVQLFREDATRYVAQANNAVCQADDARIAAFRRRTAQIWFPGVRESAMRLIAENPGVPIEQDTPTPDLLVESRLTLSADGLQMALLAAVGETIDSLVVWLPEHRLALTSNLLGPLFPHFPNFNTLRGDRYRLVEPYLASVRMLRELRPEVLVTGRGEPIRGADLIDACLGRLHDAVAYVHEQTLDGINAGLDVWALMERITLPPRLRVGEGYGKVSWAVRTIWETYVGWFKLQSTTELYPDRRIDAMAELVALSGTDAALARARVALERGDAVLAISLVEGVERNAPANEDAMAMRRAAHAALLASGGAKNFWERGWLTTAGSLVADVDGESGS